MGFIKNQADMIVDQISAETKNAVDREIRIKGRKIARNAVLSYVEATRVGGEIQDNDGKAYAFVVQQKRRTIGRKYNVFDRDGKLKYIIKKQHFRRAFPCLKIINMEDEVIGKVVLRSFHDFGKRKIYYKGNMVGSFSKKFSMKPVFYLDMNGWTIESAFTQHSFAVRDDANNLILKINLVQGHGERYIFEISDSRYEVEALLLWMAINIRHKYE